MKKPNQKEKLTLRKQTIHDLRRLRPVNDDRLQQVAGGDTTYIIWDREP